MPGGDRRAARGGGALAHAPRAVEPPEDLRSRTLAAVHRAATESYTEAPQRAPRRRLGLRLALGGAFAASLAAAVLVGTRLDDDGGPGGPVELRTTLVAASGATAAAAEVVKLGIGREIAFSSDDLPILPKGEFYELWFVGPGDTLESPNRISAGTFHPDEQGRSHASFTAAVDPAKYPVLSVTAEPGDGNPQRTGPEVLRSG